VGTASDVTAGPEPDIDEMLVRLERMSVERFKKTPKQLAEERFADDESTEPASEK